MTILPVSDILTTPTCNKCKHLLGRRDSITSADKWKCVHPSNIKSKGINVVTGELHTIYIHETCADARIAIQACAELGNWYEEYVYPVSQYQPIDIKPAFGSNASAVPSERLRQIRAAASKKKLSENDLDNL